MSSSYNLSMMKVLSGLQIPISSHKSSDFYSPLWDVNRSECRGCNLHSGYPSVFLLKYQSTTHYQGAINRCSPI
jgi:hypothetical protein